MGTFEKGKVDIEEVQPGVQVVGIRNKTDAPMDVGLPEMLPKDKVLEIFRIERGSKIKKEQQ